MFSFLLRKNFLGVGGGGGSSAVLEPRLILFLCIKLHNPSLCISLSFFFFF